MIEEIEEEEAFSFRSLKNRQNDHIGRVEVNGTSRYYERFHKTGGPLGDV
jgi:hypothetical protein